MEIGGYDLICEWTQPSKLAVDIIKRILKENWPEVVYELEGDNEYNFFAYKDLSTKNLWDKDVPEGEAPMIYVLFDEGKCVTFVYDKDSKDVAKKLWIEIFNTPGCGTCRIKGRQ